MKSIFWIITGILIAGNLAMADLAPPNRPKTDVIPEEGHRNPGTETRNHDSRPAEPPEDSPALVQEIDPSSLILGLAAGVLVLGTGAMIVLRTKKN